MILTPGATVPKCSKVHNSRENAHLIKRNSNDNKGVKYRQCLKHSKAQDFTLKSIKVTHPQPFKWSQGQMKTKTWDSTNSLNNQNIQSNGSNTNEFYTLEYKQWNKEAHVNTKNKTMKS